MIFFLISKYNNKDGWKTQLDPLKYTIMGSSVHFGNVNIDVCFIRVFTLEKNPK